MIFKRPWDAMMSTTLIFTSVKHPRPLPPYHNPKTPHIAPHFS